jgi:hypothetical protein
MKGKRMPISVGRTVALTMLAAGAEFEYEAASDTFRPGTLSDRPPQGNDAKCGFACHTAAKNQDYVFTEYPKR